MADEALTDRAVDGFGTGQVTGHFVGALNISGTKLVADVGIGGGTLDGHLTMKHLNVTDGHFEDVGLLELVVASGVFALVVIQNEVLQLVERVVDSGTAPFLHDRLRGAALVAGLPLGGCGGVHLEMCGCGVEVEKLEH